MPFPPPFRGRPTFVPFLRTNLISTLLLSACATRISAAIAKLRGSFSLAEIFGALISAFAASFACLRFSAARSFAICTPKLQILELALDQPSQLRILHLLLNRTASIFPRVHRRHQWFCFAHFLPPLLVIIHNFHVVAMPVATNEANSPLVVNPNRMLPFPVTGERL